MASFRRTSMKVGEIAINGDEGDNLKSINGEEEYMVEDLRDRIKSSRGSRFTLIENELGLDPTHRRFSRQSVINGLKDLSEGLFIHPDNRDSHSYKMVYNHNLIALRYLKSHFILDLLACIFYYLATTLPEEKEGYTWIGSLKLGDYSYSHFREIDIWKRYTTSLYFAIVTMATVGYGDIHAVNLREMIFIMIYVSFDMILGAYLIGHLRLQYESSYTDAAVLQDIPISIRAKISQTLYKSYVENIALFKDCSSEFINQIVTRVHEEFFLPGEVIMEQGNVVDQLYFVCHGILEEVGIGADGLEETVSLLEPNSLFGEISILCNIPQPYTVRVCELCRLLRIDKQSFSNILEIYFHDGRKVLTNLLEGKESNLRVKQLESDITFHITKQEAELALRMNSAAYYGDLYQLKSLIRSGADPDKKDYDGRTALVWIRLLNIYPRHFNIIRKLNTLKIASEGDNFGNTPLFEAIKSGHDRVASLLSREGAVLKIDNVGSFLCTIVARGDSDLLRRVLSNGVDPNSKDYDQRTALHIAASQGLYLMAKLLLEAGASVFSKDKWGNTPMDEGRMCGNKNMIRLLEEAKMAQLSKVPDSSQEVTDKSHAKKCTVFPFHPWHPNEGRKPGIVMWVPHTIEELIKSASEQLQIELPDGSYILSEDGGKIVEVDMISDGQKLYMMINETTD
ncbi:hypothetical protein DH2020_038772 [Rehmannia glutinosa]|uniref:Potassium channel n=1 Tax=Rehmannia glutinosa TaxID=99300 RepID=A0ABR0UYX0_REHGL